MIVSGIFALVLLLLPTLTITIDIASALITLSPYLAIVNYYFPLDIFVSCAVSVFATWLISVCFHIVIEIL